MLDTQWVFFGFKPWHLINICQIYYGTYAAKIDSTKPTRVDFATRELGNVAQSLYFSEPIFPLDGAE